MILPIFAPSHIVPLVFLQNLAYGALIPSALSPPLPAGPDQTEISTPSNFTLPLDSAPRFYPIPNSPYLLRIISLSPVLSPTSVAHPILSVANTQREILHSAKAYCEDKIHITGRGHDLAVQDRDLPFVDWLRGYGVRVQELDWRPVTPPREREGGRRTQRIKTKRTMKPKRRTKREGNGNVGTMIDASGPNSTTSANSSQDLQQSLASTGNTLQGRLTWAAIWFAMEGLRIHVVNPAAANGSPLGGAREAVNAELWERGGKFSLAHLELFRGGGSPI